MPKQQKTALNLAKFIQNQSLLCRLYTSDSSNELPIGKLSCSRLNKKKNRKK
ncbi:Rop family plasmid primer RNA-binding protein [Klebsiella pneumoniae]|uniref:Rop family plasmid primer RNA-binding protein n=1 Tax=Klebsiella pneumoniae TaxID=573 RepID=UPI003D679351